MSEIEKQKENEPDKKVKWLSVAGSMWKELSTEDKKVYEDKVQNS